jgi:hypothetical protein
VTRIGEPGTTLAVTSSKRKLRRNAMSYMPIYSISSQRASVDSANVIPRSPILITLMMEALISS